jgi:hypothetical protein
VNAHPENGGQTAYQCWAHTVAGVLTWPLQLLETQCRLGLEIAEAAVRIPGGPQTGPDAGPRVADELRRLEGLAVERAQKGLAPPREIYRAPYRDRVDWSRLPEWARPIDPEVFQDCGHEG